MSREPHSSTDEESAPLLDQQDEEQDSFFTRFGALTQEPLTAFTKILLAVVLILLILTSVFIGLFAGAEHRLSSRPLPGDGKRATITTTATSTTTETSVIITAPLPGPTPDPREQPCLNANCIVLSASILNSLDTSQDPCEDFYDFATGGWLKANPLPADKGIYGTFHEVTIENQRSIRRILSKNSSSLPASDSQTLTKLQGLYQSCLDEDYLNTLGIEPLKQVVQNIRRIFNGSSTVTEISSSSSGQHVFYALSKEGLTSAIAYLHSLGINALFSFDVDGDVGVDPNHMTLWFSQPGLGLPSKEYFEEDSIRELYTRTMTRIFRTLDGNAKELNEVRMSKRSFWPPFPWPPWGDDENPGDKKKTAKELADAVVQFERDISHAGLDLDVLYQDPVGTYNPMPFANLSASVPELDFPNYWSTFAPRSFPERVIVTYPAYLTSLSSLLSNTSSDVIEGYLIARTALSLAEYLGADTEIWKANRELTEELGGIKKGAVGDRAEYCSGKVETGLGFAIGRFFVQDTFSGDSQSKATHVIKDIVETFKKSLKNLDWMDKTSADAATEKASAIRIKVGFPLSPNTLDAQAISRYYSGVNILKDEFFGNMLSASIHDETLKWAKLGKRRDNDSWEMIPSEVNAYFNPPANEIVFPAGIMRAPFFSKDWPAYLTYGAFGEIAAHELTHAFDSAGRLYDQEGKLRQWWTNATSDAFDGRRDCIARQYSNYTVDDGKGGHVHVNGNLTSGENIGDAGLVQAYRAWKSQFNTSLTAGNEYVLPGLNYTRDQLFFISFARTWAQNINPQTAVQRVRTDPHSPNQHRVLGTLVNIPAFAEAFNCPVGSKLNPPIEQQCRLW